VRFWGRLLLSGLVACFGTAFPTQVVAGDSLVLGFESDSQRENWQPITFSGIRKTKYRFDMDQKKLCGRAESSASGLAVDFPGSLQEFPVLSWEWYISGTVKGGDVRSKQTDDYSARVYVNFERTGEGFSWWERTQAEVFQTVYGRELPGKTLTFIWGNRQTGDTIVTSPYTRHSKMIALRRGNKLANQWVFERIDISEWFRKSFGRDPPPVHSIAIMTDTDNTGEITSACYRRIRLLTEE